MPSYEEAEGKMKRDEMECDVLVFSGSAWRTLDKFLTQRGEL